MSERSDEKELEIDGIPKIVEDLDLNFDYGINMNKSIPVIDILYSVNGGKSKTDNIVVAPRIGLLINKKVRDILDSLNINNIEYYSTRLINKSNDEIDEDYKIANIIGQIECVDKKNSELEFYADGEIEFIDKLVLNLEKDKHYGHIFRLSEFLPLIVISNSLKTKIEEEKITGFKIYAPKDFCL
ncbi:imm11 family protein [Aquimarina sp. 2201CG5-10]|uniref:imm11 family protein n=1 Tax=Aquimarina callyspongiae TaxID=3098150 RepID=UPI002AC996D5|nr:DUF1629 domain-containing protein [Aquimarina sp. 2201CG5-10]